MAQILEITLFMWIVAIVSFAPLGYFLYLYMTGKGQFFGKSDPDSHAVESTPSYKIIDDTLCALLGRTEPAPRAPAKRRATPAVATDQGVVTSRIATPHTNKRRASTKRRVPYQQRNA